MIYENSEIPESLLRLGQPCLCCAKQKPNAKRGDKFYGGRISFSNPKLLTIYVDELTIPKKLQTMKQLSQKPIERKQPTKKPPEVHNSNNNNKKPAKSIIYLPEVPN